MKIPSMRGSVGLTLVAACLAVACSKSGSSAKPPGVPDPGVPTVPGEPDLSVDTALPPVPTLFNVSAVVTGDSAIIKFDPVDGAKDYRVYPLPADEDITTSADGHVTIKNAIYRCAGNREAPPIIPDDAPAKKDRTLYFDTFRSFVDNKDVQGYTRKLAEATLGYVYATPGEGRTPVYAMGDPAGTSENQCGNDTGWGSTRVKQYVAGEAAYKDLVKQGWRDDGIAFYVPAPGSEGTHEVYTSAEEWYRFYFVDGPEFGVRPHHDVAFSVLDEPGAADVKPLMRVYESNPCGMKHDELVAGQARFDRARYEGDQLPAWEATWSGLTEETTMVVEALDTGCPYQGFLAPTTTEAVTGNGIDYPAHVTIADVQAASPTGEVFVNGQHDDVKTNPRPIARSFIKVKPAAAPTDYDWFSGFENAEALGGEMVASFCNNNDECDRNNIEENDLLHLSWEVADHYAYGVQLGQLWVNYADIGADVGGKFRLTPKTKGTMNADTYLHVTMQVDAFTSGRRYPQMFVSDQEPPIQGRIPNGRTFVIQPFGTWPPTYELQVCDHRKWDVNDQCPKYEFRRVTDPNDSGKIMKQLPVPFVSETFGADRPTTIEAYLSGKRAYLFLDGKPFGCANVPGSDGAMPPSGPVTVTFADVLYHSGVDDYTMGHHRTHLQIENMRRYDNLGFKSGVAAPAWDESKYPCTGKTLK
jgi:hypothetical protein